VFDLDERAALKPGNTLANTQARQLQVLLGDVLFYGADRLMRFLV
jgi:hypothetical protein